MFPNWLYLVSEKHIATIVTCDLRMHCTKNVGDNQPAGAGASIKFDVSAIRCSANPVESDCALNRGVDTFDCNSNDTPLVV